MAHLSPELVQSRLDEFGKLNFIDEIVRQRSKDATQVPILGYPKYDNNASEYEFFTGKELDKMVDEACRALVQKGLKVNDHKTVALFAPSDLSFVVTFFALFRLGCKVLTMSIRLGPPACLALLDRAECNTILHGNTPRINETISELKTERTDVRTIPMLHRSEFDKPDAPVQPFVREADAEKEHTQIALIMHSSGSTGLPKPLILSHRSLLSTLVQGNGMKAFNALPWYHLHGLITSVQAMWMRKAAHLFNASLPLTADNLISALDTIQPEIVHSVPYVLKLIAEQPSGVETLKRCQRVTGAGARTPDELGDRLVKAGVPLGTIFGLTEVGHVGDSIHREPGDDSWAYIRPYANIRKFIWFKKLNEDTYESVYLKGHPALMITNSDEPPGSFHSKDLFTPHPTVPDAWKYVARDDDRVTLINGEKILPLSMEGRLREDPLVRDCLLVGIDRPVPGMLVFRAESAAHMSDDEFVRAIWPSVESANIIADEFARITPDMVAPIAAEVDFPATDKGNIIRAQTYRVFADKIEALYERLESGMSLANGEGKNLQLSVPELERFLLDTFRNQAGVDLRDNASDFFAAGVDSLRAIQVRRLLQKDLDLGGHILPTNIVYDKGNVAKLAQHLYALRTGEDLANGHHEQEIDTMQSIIQEHSSFSKHTPRNSSTPSTDTVVLTGATGTLGVHVLAELLSRPSVSQVYCLVRGSEPLGRVLTTLKSRKLTSLPESAYEKLKAFTSDLSQPSLGLDATTLNEIRSSATLIIHAAWPVTFNVSLASFAPQVASLHHLLQLSLSVPHPQPARMLFASSISTAFESPSNVATIAEAPIPRLSHAAGTGYARSKLVGERVCESAGQQGARVGVLRIGQIVGDVEGADWNEKEAVPLMVRSALELKALPALNDACEWIPVDVTARTILELAENMDGSSNLHTNGVDTATANGSGIKTNGVNGQAHHDEVDISHPAASYYNIVAPSYFDWTNGFLPALSSAGLGFKIVPFAEWISLLRSAADNLGAEAEKRIPAAKLVDYYANTFGQQESDASKTIRFSTSKACTHSQALETSPDVVKTGLAHRFLEVWLGKWT